MTNPEPIEPIKPCLHMKGLISALVDGNLSGLIQHYALWHVDHCPRCKAALAALTQMSVRLRALGAAPAPGAGAAETPALSSDRWAAMEAAWDEADRSP